MLSNNLIKNFGLRVKLMVYSGLTVYGWDSKTMQLTSQPNKYLYWNWLLCLAGGYTLCLMFAIQIYIKIKNTDENVKTATQFAILVLTWGELIPVMTISLLAYRIYRVQHEIMYALNQMFHYHKQISKWLKERQIEMDDEHKKRVRMGELNIYSVCYGSWLLPFILLVACFHPLEPTHNILLDWFEFDLNIHNIRLAHLTLVPFFFLSIHAAGNTVITYGILVTCYYLIATSDLADMTPTEIARKKDSRRYVFQTQYYGELEDDEIIFRYRTQQLLNILVNQIFKSIFVSLQHVACLAVCSIMAYFAIKFPEVLAETGVVGYIIVGVCFGTGIVIEFLQAYMLGILVDISDNFITQIDTMMGRRALMKKFVKSCNTFYIEEAYPFFRVNRGTFLEFYANVVDQTITLLLW